MRKSLLLVLVVVFILSSQVQAEEYDFYLMFENCESTISYNENI